MEEKRLNADEANECRNNIIDMLNKIEDIKILKLLQGFVTAGYREELAGK